MGHRIPYTRSLYKQNYLVSATLIAFICDCPTISWFSHGFFKYLLPCGKNQETLLPRPRSFTQPGTFLGGRQTLQPFAGARMASGCNIHQNARHWLCYPHSQASSVVKTHFPGFGILQLVVLSFHLGCVFPTTQACFKAYEFLKPIMRALCLQMGGRAAPPSQPPPF